MRVSEKQRYDIATHRIEGAKANNSKALETLSSQKRIGRVSDDPTGVAKLIRGKERVSEMQQLQRNINFSQGFLERTESAVSGIHENLMRAKELAVSLANDTYAADSRAAAGREIAQIIKDVTSLANTTFSNRYVFSGFRTQTPSLDPDHGYLGDDGAIFLQIDDRMMLQVNLQARNLFEPTVEERNAEHIGLLDTLNIFHNGLMTNDKNLIHKSLEELDFQLGKTSSYQATVGARSKALDDAMSRVQLDQDFAIEQNSKLEDADAFQATSDFKRTDGILQSTLMASNKMLQPSLMNFLQ